MPGAELPLFKKNREKSLLPKRCAEVGETVRGVPFEVHCYVHNETGGTKGLRSSFEVQTPVEY